MFEYFDDRKDDRKDASAPTDTDAETPEEPSDMSEYEWPEEGGADGERDPEKGDHATSADESKSPTDGVGG